MLVIEPDIFYEYVGMSYVDKNILGPLVHMYNGVFKHLMSTRGKYPNKNFHCNLCTSCTSFCTHTHTHSMNCCYMYHNSLMGRKHKK